MINDIMRKSQKGPKALSSKGGNMNSELIFSVKDLLLFILWALLVGIFGYLILILHRAFKMVKQVSKIVEDNKESIDKTLAIVPDLTQNIESISGEVSHDISAFRETIDNVSETTESVTETINENKSFIDGLSSFMHTISIGKALYDKYFGDKIVDIKDVVSEVEKEMSKES